MKSIFVTGTDTGVGKTIICGLLGRYLLDRGYKAITQKWIQSGRGVSCGDTSEHLRLMKISETEIKKYLPHIQPYNFKFASSPHLAACLEGGEINANKIYRSFRVLSRNFDIVIVEGIGGALVPYDKKHLVIDIARKLHLPVLIVAGNRLGAINHTLLTIEAIKRRNMKLIGIIFNNIGKKLDRIISEDNPRIVKGLSGEKILGVLPKSRNKELLYKKFIPIGNRIEGWIAG